MVITGKTGADAIAKALHRICLVLSHYRTKCDAVITAAEAAGAITAAQATAAHDFLGTANTVCSIFELVAGYSNVN